MRVLTRVGALLAIAIPLLGSGCGLSAVVAVSVASSVGGSSSSASAPTPTITALSPAEGNHGGGAQITITGADFAPNAIVSFGTVKATQVTFVDGATLQVILPANAKTGAVDVSVEAGGVTGRLASAFTYTNTLPTLTLLPISDPQTGNIVFSFQVTDSESDPVDVNVELDSGSGFQAVKAVDLVSGGTTGLASTPQGQTPKTHSLTYNSASLFDQKDAATVRLRVTPTDTSDNKAGTAGTSNTFAVKNNTPPTVELTQNGNDGNNVVLTYKVSDPDSKDTKQVTSLRWQDLGTSQSGAITVASGQTTGTISGSTAGGKILQTVWNSLADVGYGNNRLVSVSVTVSDGSSSQTGTSSPFFVSNGPISNTTTLSSQGASQGIVLGDVHDDSRADLITFSLGQNGHLGSSANVVIFKNQGFEFDAATATKIKDIPATVPAFVAAPAPPTAPANTFLIAAAHPTIGAVLDVNGDGKKDLIVGSSLHSASAIALPLARAPAAIVGMALGDVGGGFARVIAHQRSLSALHNAGNPDLAGGTFESMQAPITRRAPHVFPTGATLFPPTITGAPQNDSIGWFAQGMEAVDLDPTGAPSAGKTDLVILQGISQLGKAFPGVPDYRGAVVIRQIDATNNLGSTYYLDPTHMGNTPVSMAVADVLSVTRTSTSYTNAPINATAALGAKDIVTANAGDSSLTFYLQTRHATFPAPGAPTFVSFKYSMILANTGAIPGDTAGVAVGDLNGDGAADIAVVGQISRKVTIFIYDTNPAATGSILGLSGGLLPFRVAANLSLPGTTGHSPFITDLTGDGRAEVVVSVLTTREQVVFVNEGSTAGTPSFKSVRFPTLSQPFLTRHGDLNGDKRIDLVSSSPAGPALRFQTSPGTLDAAFVPVSTGAAPAELGLGDVDGDGSPEVVCPNSQDNNVSVFSRATGSLKELKRISTALVPPPPPKFTTPILPTFAIVKDLDADGKNDVGVLMQTVIEGTSVLSGWTLIKGTPLAASLASVNTSIQSFNGTGLDAGDVNEDGKPDVYLAVLPGNGITVFTGTGGGAFTKAAFGHAYVTPRSVRVVDLDGDGHLDLVVTSVSGVTVHYNGGNPTGAVPFGTLGIPPVTLPYPSTDAVRIATGDFDGNGRLDLVINSETLSTAHVLYQTSSRTFSAQSLLVAGPRQMACGDLNGDGKDDLAICWGTQNLVAVYYQDPGGVPLATKLGQPVLYKTAASPDGCVVLDVNGDGRKDLVVSARSANALNVFFQR